MQKILVLTTITAILSCGCQSQPKPAGHGPNRMHNDGMHKNQMMQDDENFHHRRQEMHKNKRGCCEAGQPETPQVQEQKTAALPSQTEAKESSEAVAKKAEPVKAVPEEKGQETVKVQAKKSEPAKEVVKQKPAPLKEKIEAVKEVAEQKAESLKKQSDVAKKEAKEAAEVASKEPSE